jgi:hypothetical protein
MTEDKLPPGFVVLDENRVRKIETKTEESGAMHVKFVSSKLVFTYKNGVWTFYDPTTDASPT